MLPVTVREIVGFDLRHGETAVARALIANTEEPQDLEINGATNQVTAVAVDASGRVVVGKNALKRPNVVSLDVTFKGRVADHNRGLLRQFMKACHEHLLETKVI